MPAAAFSRCKSWIDFAGPAGAAGLLAAEPRDIDHRSSKLPLDAGLGAAGAEAGAPRTELVREALVELGVMIGEV